MDKYKTIHTVLICIFILAVSLGITVGVTDVSWIDVIKNILFKVGIFSDPVLTSSEELIIYSLRLPRVIQAGLVGATLAISGVAMQGLFRNHLADPGLLGISSGASFFASISIVSGLTFFGTYTLPSMAFIGSLLTMLLIVILGHRSKILNISALILLGVAINAIAGAGSSLLSFLASNEELRTISLWQMGSIGNANFDDMLIMIIPCLLTIITLSRMSTNLNALLLGESNAKSLGINVIKSKWIIILMVSLGVGVCVAYSGIIGFVGLIVPYILRLLLGADHKKLLILSTLLGSSLLILADLFARILISPIELPIGILTAIIGAPIFIFLLINKNKVCR